MILQVGTEAVKTPHDVDAALDAARNDAVLLQIERQGSKIFVGVRLA